MNNPNDPLDLDEVIIGKPGSAKTICGYCVQGRHDQCHGLVCYCRDKDHKMTPGY